MEDNGWLRILLEQMHSDIDDIKLEIKGLKEFKFKIMGGIIVASFLVSALTQAVIHWIK